MMGWLRGGIGTKLVPPLIWSRSWRLMVAID